MKLIELLHEETDSFISNNDLLRQKHKEDDLKRDPSPEGEGNRLSPLSIPKELPLFKRAIGPLGGLRKDGSKKEPKKNYTSADYDVVPMGNPIPVVPSVSKT